MISTAVDAWMPRRRVLAFTRSLQGSECPSFQINGDFDGSDDPQSAWLCSQGVDPALAPRHLVPSTHELADAVVAGLGWGMLLTMQAEPLLARGALIALGGDPVTSALFWQVATTRSALLEALTDTVLETARRELEQR
ncbi:MAG: LysR substrate-binding domain-containing protein [Brachybacterium sp.]|nr:LysR substrate-binding domain-containing protein [Brachybacterium sp.]